MTAATMGVTMSPAGAADAQLATTLLGANERPGPGDPDATGRAVITIIDDTNTLCIAMTWRDVDGTVSGLHIHQAPSTSPGPIVVPFTTPTGNSGTFRQCVTVANETVLDSMSTDPGNFYLNIHSTPSFGPGAARGQLEFFS
jgi:hypothetical protein